MTISCLCYVSECLSVKLSSTKFADEPLTDKLICFYEANVPMKPKSTNLLSERFLIYHKVKKGCPLDSDPECLNPRIGFTH